MDGIEEYKAALQESHDRMFASLRGCLADFQKQALATDLRAQFAGQAMQGMLAHPTRYKPREGASTNWHEAISEEALQLADALLAARKGGA